MEVTVTHKQGLEVPEEWRVLGIQQFWIVSVGGDMVGVFFDAGEAQAYVEWVLWRLKQEQEMEAELSPPPGMR